jgi:hypothetical protein
MISQNISLELRGATELLSHSGRWQTDADAPEYSIELPRDGELILSSASVGKITIEGGLQLDMARSQAGSRLFIWTPAARAAGSDGDEATITITHPNDDFSNLTIFVRRAEEASLTVDEEERSAAAVAVAFGDRESLKAIVTEYGAFFVAGLASVFALLFAYIMPAHQHELLVGAGMIAIWGWIATEEGDAFGARILLFLAAGVAMCFALAMPDNAEYLIDGAGVLSALAIWFGDEF